MGKVNLREAQLLEVLREKSQLDMKEIIDLFHISDSTARRMCVEIERKGLAIRTLGGLRALPEKTQPSAPYSYNASEMEHAAQKKKIGRYASSLIKDGEVIFLTGGTTVQRMAEALVERMKEENLKNLMILTNSVACAEMLAAHCTVILTGGKLRLERRDMAGFISEQMVRNARFDKCFVGVDGIDLHEGLMALDLDTANLDRIAVDQSDAAYILADSSKFRRTYFTAYEHFLPKHTVITDDALSADMVSYAHSNGIDLRTV